MGGAHRSDRRYWTRCVLFHRLPHSFLIFMASQVAEGASLFYMTPPTTLSPLSPISTPSHICTPLHFLPTAGVHYTPRCRYITNSFAGRNQSTATTPVPTGKHRGSTQRLRRERTAARPGSVIFCPMPESTRMARPVCVTRAGPGPQGMRMLLPNSSFGN
jgi:hypothetical protein